MRYVPQFTITAVLAGRLEAIAALREKIQAATIQVPWIPALQLDTRTRNAHSSTAIEGNTLTLAQVRALAEGRTVSAPQRARHEVLNYFAAVRFIERRAKRVTLRHQDILDLHRLMATNVMDQGLAGCYRSMGVRVEHHVAPRPEKVEPLMSALLAWWNTEAPRWSPVISSAIVHFRFEDIHPFADGNGRTGRALALWELYRRGFDTQHIFAVDEWYWDDRPRYYAAFDAVRAAEHDLTSWLEYTAEGVQQTLERVWLRVQRLSARAGTMPIVLRPKQEQVLQLLSEHQSLTPRALWEHLGMSKQAAAKLLRPLLEARLIRRIGSRKSGRYVLARPAEP